MNDSAMPGLVYVVPGQEEETLRRVIEKWILFPKIDGSRKAQYSSKESLA